MEHLLQHLFHLIVIQLEQPTIIFAECDRQRSHRTEVQHLFICREYQKFYKNFIDDLEIFSKNVRSSDFEGVANFSKKLNQENPSMFHSIVIDNIWYYTKPDGLVKHGTLLAPYKDTLTWTPPSQRLNIIVSFSPVRHASHIIVIAPTLYRNLFQRQQELQQSIVFELFSFNDFR